MPTNRKDNVKKILEALGLSISDLADGAGFNSRQALNRYFKKDQDISIDLYEKLINFLNTKDKNIVSSFNQTTGNIEGSGVVIASSNLDKSEVKEVNNNFKCAYNAKEMNKIFNSGIDKAMEGFERLLAEKDARLKEKDDRIADLKETIAMLKSRGNR
jgi:transcriptional regulator with XRE-family HTH domain